MLNVYLVKLVNGLTRSVQAPNVEEALRDMGTARVAGITFSLSETLRVNYGGKRVVMTTKEALQFSQQMAIFMRVMNDFTTAATMSFARFSDKKAVVRRMTALRQKIASGARLSEAISAIGFPREYAPVIRMAEDNNSLPEAFERISNSIHERQILFAAIVSALVTPVLTILVLSAAFVAMLLFVFPRLTQLFKEAQGVQGSSALELDMFMVDNKYALLSLVLATVATLIVAVVSRKGRAILTKGLFYVPFFKDLILVFRATRLSLALEMPLTSAQTVYDSVKKVMETASTADRRVLRKILVSVEAGHSLGDAIAATRFYPQDFADWVGSVQKAGRLPVEISTIRSTYEEILKQRFSTVKTVVGPLLIFIAGGLIVVVAGALYAPILQLVQSFMTQSN